MTAADAVGPAASAYNFGVAFPAPAMRLLLILSLVSLAASVPLARTLSG